MDFVFRDGVWLAGTDHPSGSVGPEGLQKESPQSSATSHRKKERYSHIKYLFVLNTVQPSISN